MMDRTHAEWAKQLDEIDHAADAIPALARSIGTWSLVAPAVPALFDAVIDAVRVYQVAAKDFRQWLDAAKGEAGHAVELNKRVAPTLHAASRLKALIDAYNREKAIAEAASRERPSGEFAVAAVAPSVSHALTGTHAQ